MSNYSTFFSISRDKSGFWLEYGRAAGFIHSLGPFSTREEARRSGEARHWNYISPNSGTAQSDSGTAQ
jgi:hypothetical protein